jgi:hypothetical protein
MPPDRPTGCAPAASDLKLPAIAVIAGWHAD